MNELKALVSDGRRDDINIGDIVESGILPELSIVEAGSELMLKFRGVGDNDFISLYDGHHSQLDFYDRVKYKGRLDIDL